MLPWKSLPADNLVYQGQLCCFYMLKHSFRSGRKGSGKVQGRQTMEVDK
jgi:hypothetical protein